MRGNIELNGFESWRLLSIKFSLPRTELDISLLTNVLESRFLPAHFEQDSSEWETLTARYEKQIGEVLPDTVLVATLLNRTTGPLQQHLRLNVRTMDSCHTARNVITASYQSRRIAHIRTVGSWGWRHSILETWWKAKRWSGKLPTFGDAGDTDNLDTWA